MHDKRPPCSLGRDADSVHRHPLPFKYKIVPRFPGMDAVQLEQLIAASTP